ncbi:MAG: hypothetical protein ACTSUT_05585 [Promethearchaeota archaeon]
MIDNLSAITRKIIVECRVIAMKGRLKIALDKLQNFININKLKILDLDQIAIFLLRAEILFLNGSDKESLDVFKNDINPMLDLIPINIRLIIEANQNEVALAQYEHGSIHKFYQSFDFRKIAGIKLKNTDAIVIADEAVRAGKHYDALPIYWQQLLSSYYLGNWKSFKWASNRLAEEYLKLNWFPQAAYYSIIAQNPSLAKKTGQFLLESNNTALIKNTVEKIINFSNLFKHANIAFLLIESIGDGIPDEQFNDVFSWLISKCSFYPENLTKANYYMNSWRVLKSLSVRFNQEQAIKTVRKAIGHKFFKTRAFYRKHLIEIIYSCRTILPKDELIKLSKITLPLAIELKSDYDYPEVINLLCFIAERVGSEVKSKFADALYPKNNQGVNAVLAQVADIFGKKISQKAKFKEYVKKVARNIKLQVQYLNPNEEPEPVLDLYFTFSSIQGGKKIVVNGTGSVHINAIIKQNKLLEISDIDLLVDAILSMINEPKNLLSNKSVLIEALKEFGHRFSKEIGDKVFKTLESIILKNKIDKDILQQIADSKNPLNPFKIEDNTPEQLSGQALYALAYIEKNNPGIFKNKINRFIENALTDTNPDVRRFAIDAARELPQLSEISLSSLLVSTRDHDKDVASTAFKAIIYKKNLKLNKFQWNILLYAIDMAVNSLDSSLRRLAALTIKNNKDNFPSTLSKKVEKLENKLLKDICYSVRSVFSKKF